MPDVASAAEFDAVAQTVAEALDFWSADVWTLSPEADQVVCRGFYSREDEAPSCAGISVPLAQSEDLRRIVLAGEWIERHADDPDLPLADTAALSAQRLQSRFDVPLELGHEVLGVMSLAERRSVRRLTPDEREDLRRLCRLAAVAAHTDARRALSEERAAHLLGLARADAVPLTSLQTQGAVATATAKTRRLLDGVPCTVDAVLRREDGSYVRLAPDGAGQDAVLQPHGVDAVARQAVRLRRTERERVRDGNARLIVPVLYGDDVLGLLDVRTAQTRGFRPHEIEVVELVAGQFASALVNARALRALEQRVATDRVTGLYARWYLHERLSAEVARARRYGQPLTLLVAEIDDLDDVLGQYGRSGRDCVVRAVARMVRTCLRDKVDVPCRHSAASFAVLLPSTAAVEAGAGLVADRLCRTVAQTQIADDDLGTLGAFTLSVGIAEYPRHCEDAEELAALAEEATRDARRRGGGQAVLAREV